jgi:Psq-like protein
MPPAENRVQEALVAVEEGMKVATAAKEYGIPRSTLHSRISSSVSAQEKNGHIQLLSDY